MPTAKVTSKGQITVPKAVRRRLDLEAGDAIEFVDADGQVVVRRLVEGSRFRKYREFLASLRGKDPDALLDELRGDA